MLNWFKTKKALLTEIDELKQSRVDLRAELILMTGNRNSWQRKYEELLPRFLKYHNKRRNHDRIKSVWVDRAKVAEVRVEELGELVAVYEQKYGLEEQTDGK